MLEDLRKAMEGLIATVEEETRLVREGSLLRAGDIEPAKARFAAEYVRLRSRVKSNATALARHAPDLAEEIRHLHLHLNAVLKTNLAVLAVAREVAEEIVRNVSEAVGRDAGPRTYGPASNVRPAVAAGARGLALDRSL